MLANTKDGMRMDFHLGVMLLDGCRKILIEVSPHATRIARKIAKIQDEHNKINAILLTLYRVSVKILSSL